MTLWFQSIPLFLYHWSTGQYLFPYRKSFFLNLMQKGGQDSLATHKLFKVWRAIAIQLIRLWGGVSGAGSSDSYGAREFWFLVVSVLLNLQFSVYSVVFSQAIIICLFFVILCHVLYWPFKTNYQKGNSQSVDKCVVKAINDSQIGSWIMQFSHEFNSPRFLHTFIFTK